MMTLLSQTMHVVAVCTRRSGGNSTVQAPLTANVCTWLLVPTLILAAPLHHPKPILWPTEELTPTFPISLLSSLPSQRTEPSSAMSVTAGSLRRPLSRDTLCKSTVTSPTSVTAARPPSATRGTLPATKPSTQVQCWPWEQLTGEAVGCWVYGCLWLGLSQAGCPQPCVTWCLIGRARCFSRHCQGALGQSSKPGNGEDGAWPRSRDGAQAALL